MDRAVFAIAATLTNQVGHTEQPLHTPVRPMDRAVFAIAAIPTKQLGQNEQLLQTPIHPMDRAVFATEPIARYAYSLQQQLPGKHDYTNGNREIETTGELPNSHTSQRICTHFR